MAAKAKSRSSKKNNSSIWQTNVLPGNPKWRGVLFVALFALVGGAGWLVYQASASTYPSLTRCKEKGTLRTGSSGSCVATLQRAVAATTQKQAGSDNNNYPLPRNPNDKDYAWDVNLYNTCNYKTSPYFVRITADGDFGPKTLAHVRCYQALAHFSRAQTDGVVGNQTWNALISDCKAYRTGYKEYHKVDCD